MSLYLRVLAHYLGEERRQAAARWSLTAGKWFATVAVWGVTTGMTLFALLLLFALCVRALS